jgi:uncharacterized membrane protein (UPF0127 family)
VREVVLRGEDGRVVCARCAVADRPLARMRGLLGRSGLAPDEGLLLRPTGSVHTAFMRFPIDVVLLDRELRVLRVVPALPPWRAAAARRARAALELPAGAAARARIAPGERLRLDG